MGKETIQALLVRWMRSNSDADLLKVLTMKQRYTQSEVDMIKFIVGNYKIRLHRGYTDELIARVREVFSANVVTNRVIMGYLDKDILLELMYDMYPIEGEPQTKHIFSNYLDYFVYNAPSLEITKTWRGDLRDILGVIDCILFNYYRYSGDEYEAKDWLDHMTFNVDKQIREEYTPQMVSSFNRGLKSMRTKYSYPLQRTSELVTDRGEAILHESIRLKTEGLFSKHKEYFDWYK